MSSSLQYQDGFYHVNDTKTNPQEAAPTTFGEQGGLKMTEDSKMTDSLADAVDDSGNGINGHADPTTESGKGDMTSLSSIEIINPTSTIGGPDLTGLSSFDSSEGSVTLPVKDMVESQTTEDGGDEDEDARREAVQEVENDSPQDPQADDDDVKDTDDKETDDVDGDKEDQEDAPGNEPDQEEEKQTVEDIGAAGDDNKADNEEENEEELEVDQEEEVMQKKSGNLKVVFVLLLVVGAGAALAIAPVVLDIDVGKQVVLVRDQVQELFKSVPTKIKETVDKVKPSHEKSVKIDPNVSEQAKKEAERQTKLEAERQEKLRAAEEKKQQEAEKKRLDEEAAKMHKFMLYVAGVVVVIVVVIIGIVCVTCAPSNGEPGRLRARDQVNVRKQPQGNNVRQRRGDLKRR